MQLVHHDAVTDDSTIRLTNVELCEIAACLGYLDMTFLDQDSVLLTLPGEQGAQRVADLNAQIHRIIDELLGKKNLLD